MICRMAKGPWSSRISGKWYLVSMALVMVPAESKAPGDSDLAPRLLELSCKSKSESMGSSLAFWSCAFKPWAGNAGEREFGGVGRVRERATVAGLLRAATTVKLSRLQEAWGISRAADAREAMLSTFVVNSSFRTMSASDARQELARHFQDKNEETIELF